MGFLVFGYQLTREQLAHADTKFELEQLRKTNENLLRSVVNVCKALGISYVEDPSIEVTRKLQQLATLERDKYKHY